MGWHVKLGPQSKMHGQRCFFPFSLSISREICSSLPKVSNLVASDTVPLQRMGDTYPISDTFGNQQVPLPMTFSNYIRFCMHWTKNIFHVSRCSNIWSAGHMIMLHNKAESDKIWSGWSEQTNVSLSQRISKGSKRIKVDLEQFQYLGITSILLDFIISL